MSFASTPFLFLFLPIAVGLYYLIPCGRGQTLRNVFLLLISLFFYAWGEPVFVFVLLLMIVLTWLLGRMAGGRKGTRTGKTAVFLTVLMNVTVILTLSKLGQLADALGLLLGRNITPAVTSLPLGMSFFGFHSVAYVVDIYRGQCKPAQRILHTALYLSVFFKILQGPIVSYREFEPQLEDRHTSWEQFGSGAWRFAVGLGKKLIIAGNLSATVQLIFSSDLSTLPLADAWLGCVLYMIYLYFDFSGYSDMAIGLAGMFGFRMPENFNYPYISVSVGEYWRRWHITLCAWFRDYLYFPILLGPSVRFRKYLLRHGVRAETAKTMQNIFVPACVWTVTALWHGTNWNYTVWGLLNCAAMLVEERLHLIKNRRVDTAVRRAAVLAFLILTKPFVCTGTLGEAGLFFRAMFGGSGCYALSPTVLYCIRTGWIFMVVGLIGCFPLIPAIREKLDKIASPRLQVVRGVVGAVMMAAIVLISVAFLIRSGTVTFLYQQ